MSGNPIEKQEVRSNLQVLLWLLERHRALETPRSRHWHEKEAEYLRQLAEAQVLLERMETVERADAEPDSRS